MGSYLEVRLGQWQQENDLGHGWVAELEHGRQEGRSLGLQDIRETVRMGCSTAAIRLESNGGQ